MLLLNSIPRFGVIISNIFAFIFYMFIFSNLDQSTGTFYGMMMFANIGFSIWALQGTFKVGEKNIDGLFGLNTLLTSFLMLFVGVFIYYILTLIQSGTSASIIGVPGLSITTASISGASIAGLALVGFAENRFWFVITDVMIQYVAPLIPAFAFFGLIQVIPVGVSAIVFGIFHFTAYSGAIGTIIWASLVMSIWLIIALFTPFEEATNWSHYIWNAVVGLKRSLSIV